LLIAAAATTRSAIATGRGFFAKENLVTQGAFENI
jgi:hypothetical protein